MFTAETPVVLFVCTGNTFRSFSAERLFRDRYGDEYTVVSAGINPHQAVPKGETKRAVRDHGANPEGHVATELTREHIAQADYAVAMAQDHQDYVRSHYNVSIPLYNEVIGDEGGIPDVDDVATGLDEHVPRVVAHLDDTMPAFHDGIEDARVDHPESYTRFNDLLDGGSHRDGTAFQAIIENEEAVAFHSLDIPDGVHDHVLVIPRQQYVYFHNIPNETVTAMMSLAQRVGQALMAENDGYNLLLNNEHQAGQCIYHAHVHVVGRFTGDGLDLEDWKHERISSKAYSQRSNKLSRMIDPDDF